MRDTSSYTDQKLPCLRQSIVQLKVGRFMLDIGWYPDEDPKGAFHCRVIEMRDTSAAMARAWVERDSRDACFTTRSTIETLRWLNFVHICAEHATTMNVSLTDPYWRGCAEFRNCTEHNLVVVVPHGYKEG